MTAVHAVPARRVTVWVAVAGALALVIVLFGDTLASGLAAFGRLDPGWTALAVAAELAAVAATAVLQRRMLRVGGVAMPRSRALRLAAATTALNLTMPAGNAVSSAFAFTRLRAWNVGPALAGFSVAASVGLSFVGFLLLSLVFGLGRSQSLLSVAGVVVAFVAVAVAVLAHRRRPDVLAGVVRRSWTRVNRLRRRDPDAGLAAIDTFFRDLRILHPRLRDWLVGSSAAAAYWLADLGCLLACAHALGLDDAGLVATAGAYVAGMSVAGLSPVPGGLGAVEAAMIVVLVQADVGHGAAAGLVIVYRSLSLGLVGVLGWTELIATRRADRRAHSVQAL